MVPMDTPTMIRTRDLSPEGLAFWGVVSGTWTLEQALGHLGNTHGLNLMRSRMSSMLTQVLHDLATRGVLDDSTTQPPFDADRRCRGCGAVHDDHPVIARSGARCFREMWGGPPPVNAAGLRKGRR